MTREYRLRREMIEIGRRLWQRGYIAANDGNLSARLSEKELLATPTGFSKGFLEPHQIVKIDLEGRKLAGALEPSSEILLHLAVYKARHDVGAVVHAHPPHATGFAVAGLSLEEPALPEVIVALGGVPLAPYATPGTPDLPETFASLLPDHDAFLLANHGAVSLGPDLLTAYYRMETLEHAAHILFIARQLGGPHLLPPDKVKELEKIRARLRRQIS